MSETDPKKKEPNSTGLSPKDLESYRRILIHKRKDLTDTQASQLSGLSDPSDRHHLADLEEMASDSSEMESLCEIMDIGDATVAQIDIALEKIDEGTFGACEACKRTIPRARLEALPFAGLCIDCQREKEREEEFQERE